MFTAQFKHRTLATLAIATTLLAPLAAVAQQPILTDEQVQAQAQSGQLDLGQQVSLLPAVYVDELHLTNTTTALAGTFSIRNDSDSTVGDIHYDVVVLSPRLAADPGILTADTPTIYSRTTGSPAYTLTAHEQLPVSFNNALPILPLGTYRVRIQLVTSNDRELGWVDQNASFGNAASFAVLTATDVAVSSQDPITKETKDAWQPLAGVNVDPNQSLALRLTAQNISTADLTGQVTVETKRLLSAGVTPTTVAHEKLSLKSNEQRTLTIPLTANAAPGAYRVLVRVVDNDGLPVSSLAEYRYVVRGQTASIIKVTADKLPTRAGAIADISFAVVGSADRTSTVSGTVIIELVDAGSVAARTESTVQFDDPTAMAGVAHLTLNRDISTSPVVHVTLRDGAGNTLDTYDTTLAAIPEGNSLTRLPRWLLWLLGLAGIAIIGLGFVVLRKRSGGSPNTKNAEFNPPPTVAIIIMLALATGLLGWNTVPPAQANGIQWRTGDLHADLWVNRPLHKSVHGSADPIVYEVRFSWYACGNASSIGKLYVYSLDTGGQVDSPFNQAWTLRGSKDQQDLGGGGSLYYTATLNLPAPYPYPSTTIWTLARAITEISDRARVNDLTWLSFQNNGGTGGGSAPECSDGIDNDNDGAVDCGIAGTTKSRFTFPNPWEIRTFINTFPQFTHIPEDPSAAPRNDTATAAKVCELKGYPTVISRTEYRYTTCYNNGIAYWDAATNDFIVMNACRDNRQLASLVCERSSTTSKPADPGCYPDNDTSRACDPLDNSENQSPIARITTTPAAPLVPDSISADGTTSTDADGTIVRWNWQVDGASVGAPTDKTISFTAAQGRTYVVKLTVADDRGATGSTTKNVVVQDLVIKAVLETTGTTLNRPVNINGSNSLPLGKITTYSWLVTGPVGAVPVANPGAATTSFTPTKTGSYTITLTVTDDRNRQDTMSVTITVAPPPFSPGDVIETE